MKEKEKTYANIMVEVGCPECGEDNNYERKLYETLPGGDIVFPCHCNKCGADFSEVFKFAYSNGDRMIKGKLVEG